MQMKQFIELMSEEIKKQIDEEVEIKTNEIMKNNGVKLIGISILTKDVNVAPTVYLDGFLKQYENGVELTELATQFVNLYNESKLNKGIDASFFSDYEQVKDRILFKLINTSLNKELLEDVPHHAFMDLEMVYYYLWDQDEFENATILIRNEHLNMWQVEENDLYTLAKENTERLLPAEVIGMGEMLQSMLKLTGELEYFSPQNDELKMHVSTNKSRLYGAATLLYSNVVQQFAYTYGKNVYILPSSVHEIILILDDDKVDPMKLNEMVREVNETQLDPKEVLADHVYFYDYQNELLSICE